MWGLDVFRRPKSPLTFLAMGVERLAGQVLLNVSRP